MQTETPQQLQEIQKRQINELKHMRWSMLLDYLNSQTMQINEILQKMEKEYPYLKETGPDSLDIIGPVDKTQTQSTIQPPINKPILKINKNK